VTTKVRWLCDISGTVALLHADGTTDVARSREGVKRGDVTYLDDDAAHRYLELGYVTHDLALKGDDLPLPFGTPSWGGSPRAGRSPYYRPPSQTAEWG
jgi:hypothetical protein